MEKIRLSGLGFAVLGIAVVLALVLAIGAHWATLQTIAWIGMAVSYSQSSTFKEALVKTFDGRHPCKLCQVVQQGKKSEKKQHRQKPMNKLDLFCFAPSLAIKAPGFLPLSTGFQRPFSALAEAPPKPPPRQILG